MRSFTALLSIVAATALSTLACSGSSASDEQPADEGALHGSGSKVLVKGVTHPGGLIVNDGHVFWSTNTFVASGDPELDQQFAYWTGKYSRANIDGAAERKLVDNNGLVSVRAAGKKIIGMTGDSCWITALDASGANPNPDNDSKTIYTDPDCNGENAGEGSPSGFEVDGDKLYIARFNNEILLGKTDGSDMKKIASIKVGDYGGALADTAFADGKLWVLTHRFPGQNAASTIPAALHSVTAAGTVKKVVDIDATGSDVYSIETDGKNIFFVQGDKILTLKAGSNKLETVDTGIGGHLASDGKNLFVGDNKTGAIYMIKDAASLPGSHTKLTDAKGIEAITASGGKVYFGTHAQSGNKATGTIEVIAIP